MHYGDQLKVYSNMWTLTVNRDKRNFKTEAFRKTEKGQRVFLTPGFEL